MLHTGIQVSPYDDIQITASGMINSGVFASGDSGPDGWDMAADGAKWPMTGDDSRRFALIGAIGEFGSYFTIGSHFPRRRFRYEYADDLYLGINTYDWTMGDPNKHFTVTVDRWTSWPNQPSLLTCFVQALDGWGIPPQLPQPDAEVIAVASASDTDDTAQFMIALRSGQLRHSIEQHNTFIQPFYPVPDPTSALAGHPVISCAGTGKADLATEFVVATDDGRALHTLRHAADGTWDAFVDIQAHAGSTGRVTAVAATTPPDSPTTTHVILATQDRRLYYTIRAADGTWSAAQDVTLALNPAGGPNLASDVVAMTLIGLNTEFGTVQLMMALADGGLWHSTRAAAGNWAPSGDVKGQIGDIGQAVSIAGTARQGDDDSEFTIITTDRKILQTRRFTNNGTWRSPDDLTVPEAAALAGIAPTAITASRTASNVAEYMVVGYPFGPN